MFKIFAVFPVGFRRKAREDKMITSEKALSLDSFSEAASIYNSINQNINRFSYVS